MLNKDLLAKCASKLHLNVLELYKTSMELNEAMGNPGLLTDTEIQNYSKVLSDRAFELITIAMAIDPTLRQQIMDPIKTDLARILKDSKPKCETESCHIVYDPQKNKVSIKKSENVSSEMIKLILKENNLPEDVTIEYIS